MRFNWSVPDGEGIEYTIRFSLSPDHDITNNILSIVVLAHYHSLDLATEKPYDAVRPGGVLLYTVNITNNGTFGPDDVTFRIDLPDTWTYRITKNGTNITHLDIEDIESIKLSILANASIGEYPIRLTVVSENGITSAVMDLTAYVVERDLTCVNVSFFRADGKEAEPVAGETTRIMLHVWNNGAQDAGSFSVSLEIDGTPHSIELAGPIAGNSSGDVNFTYPFQKGGTHNLVFALDVWDDVKEYEEHNNGLSVPLFVRPEQANSSFVFRVRITDLSGANVVDAMVSARSGASEVQNVTDVNGNASMTLLENYYEGSIYTVEAIKGDLYAAAEVWVYSEDESVDISLVVGRYSIALDCRQRDKEMMPGSDQQFSFDMENTGDFADSYLVIIIGLPNKWDALITGADVENGTIHIGKDASTRFFLNLTSWRFAPAYERTEIVIQVSSTLAPMTNEILVRVSMLPVENITISTDDPGEPGSPGEAIPHRITIRNEGNTIRTIDLLVGGDTDSCHLNLDEVTLSPGAYSDVWFYVDIPYLRAGSVLQHMVFGVVSGTGTTNSLNFSTTILPYNKPDRISVTIIDIPGEHGTASQSLQVKNNGNVVEDLVISMGFASGSIELDSTHVVVDMGGTVKIPFEVEMDDMGIPSGSLVNVQLAIHNGEAWFNVTRQISVPEVHDLTLSLVTGDMEVVPGTTATFRIEVTNGGNTAELVSFSRTNSGNEPIYIPPPLELGMNSDEEVTASMKIPEHAQGIRNITITGTSGSTNASIQFSVNISGQRAVSLSLFSVRPFEGGSKYSLDLENGGLEDKIVDIRSTCGLLDIRRTSVMAGEIVRIILVIPSETSCQDPLTVTAVSNTTPSVNATLILVPPPVAEIIMLSQSPISIDHILRLRGMGNFSKYRWSVGSHEYLGRDLEYRFTNSGAHTVELTVTDDRDLVAVTSLEINVENLLPNIVINNRLTGKVGEYTGMSAMDTRDRDGTITSYVWAIGNTTHHGVEVYHLFKTEGTHTVKLTVTDNLGAVNSTTFIVTILPPSESTGEDETEEKIDMGMVAATSLLLIVVILGFLVSFSRLNRRESELVDEVQAMAVVGTAHQSDGGSSKQSHEAEPPVEEVEP